MESIQGPVISLDMKKKRIRIHKQTLHQLNDPCYLQLLVNPDKKTIALKACNKHSHLAHKINSKADVDCEFYSKELLFQLQNVYPELVDGHTYRIPGELYPEKGLAIFYIDRLVPVCESTSENNAV